MTILKTSSVAALSLVLLAGCDTGMGGGSVAIESGLSYDDFQRQYDVDQPTLVAMDANSDGVISENERLAAGY